MHHRRLRLIWLCLLWLGACARAPEFDLVVRGGEVIDGTGAPPRRADVGIRGDRIAFVGELGRRRGQREIDASGLVVAPGFIDVQGQSGTTLLVDGTAQSHVRQGITTEVIGEGSTPALWTPARFEEEAVQRFGIRVDWASFDGYLKALERGGISVNLGSFASVNQIRRDVVGLGNRPATAEELARMEAVLDQAMREGSFGLASALIYPPGSFTTTDELVRLARVAARHGGIYMTHVRGESFRVKEAIQEAIAIGEQARLPVVIYHLKVAARPYWGSMGEIGKLIEAARARGVAVSACQYPYTAGATSLTATLPGWVQEGGREAMLRRLRDPRLRRRIRQEIETATEGWENLVKGAGFEGIQIASVPPETDESIVGKTIARIAAERRQDPWETLFGILVDYEGRVGAIYHMMSEEDVRTAMRFPWVSVGTDSGAIRPDGPLGRGQPHPRAYGTFPRILGRYVRDEQVLSLAEAVRKMTSLAAAQLKIPERGVIREGYFADLVVFDPRQVRDTATFEQPHQYPVGIVTVVVNGVVTVDRGEHTGAKAGRALFGPGYRTATGTS